MKNCSDNLSPELEALSRRLLEQMRRQHRQTLNLLRDALRVRETIGPDALKRGEGDRGEAEARREIVEQWEKAMDAAVEKGQSKDAATQRFLSRLKSQRGLVICRRTLYRWATVYRQRGMRGLDDGRRSGRNQT